MKPINRWESYQPSKTQSSERGDFIDEGGWTLTAGEKLPTGGTADLGAEERLAMDQLPPFDEQVRKVGG